jgi:protein-L-isoaspartate(D-aspartate) O-methyltransferase
MVPDKASSLLRRLRAAIAAAVLVATAPTTFAADDEFAGRRQALIAEIAANVREDAAETGRAKLDPRVMDALGRVPRHRFVPFAETRNAYENRPLPIGHGQTISQPYVVALMTDLVNPKPDHVVLEIGTGSGYQAAILAELVATVCTIEIVEPLAREAAARLAALGYGRVRTKVGDGYYGWEECGPFDAIVVTAAANHVPAPLVRQLKPGGRMIVPVGAPFMTQHLLLVEKRPDGTIATRQVLPVAFVPLTGKH